MDVTFDYFQQQEVKVRVLDKRGKTLLRLNGKGGSAGSFPSGSFYPFYKVVVVNGFTDIAEHRAMEPIVYMTDDPAVWKWLAP